MQRVTKTPIAINPLLAAWRTDRGNYVQVSDTRKTCYGMFSVEVYQIGYGYDIAYSNKNLSKCLDVAEQLAKNF